MPYTLQADSPRAKKPEKYIRPKKTPPPQFVDAMPATEDETDFRHSWWKVKREKVRAMLAVSGTRPAALYAFDNCGAECVVEFSVEANKWRLRANYCKCRHCEACMKSKANKLAANLRKRLLQTADGRYRFITLTLRHTDNPLTDQIKRLYKSFTKLRNSKAWKKSQRGGAFCLEVKFNSKTRQWHPHIHVISEGDFLDKFDLSRAWLAATGDSPIVDIRALKSEKDAAHYVAKYVTKGTSSDVWNDLDAAQEWIAATKGVRVCATYGTWRGYKLTEHVDEFSDWKPVGRFQAIIDAAQRMEAWAMAIVNGIFPSSNPDEANKSRGKRAGPA